LNTEEKQSGRKKPPVFATSGEENQEKGKRGHPVMGEGKEESSEWEKGVI